MSRNISPAAILTHFSAIPVPKSLNSETFSQFLFSPHLRSCSLTTSSLLQFIKDCKHTVQEFIFLISQFAQTLLLSATMIWWQPPFLELVPAADFNITQENEALLSFRFPKLPTISPYLPFFFLQSKYMTPVPFHPHQPIIFPFDLSFYLHQILFMLIMVTTVFFWIHSACY